MSKDLEQAWTARVASGRPEWGGRTPTALFERLGVAPALGEAFCRLADAALATVDPRTAEIVALRVAAHRQSRYVWAGHVAIALSRPDRGRLTPEEVSRVAAGPWTLSGDDAVTAQAVDDRLLIGGFGGATAEAVGDRAPGLGLVITVYELMVKIMVGVDPDEPPVEGLETPGLAASNMGRWPR